MAESPQHRPEGSSLPPDPFPELTLPEDRPRYGQRDPHPALAPRASGTLGSGSGFDRPRALRRMGYGLSFAALLLGILVVFGLLATGSAGWSVLGVAPILLGLAGLVAVRWRLLGSLRDPGGRVRRPGARLLWLPVLLALLGIAALVVSYWAPHLVHGSEVLVRNHVVLWTEIGLVLLLAASLSAGLIALSHWTVPDEDESILRRTDYAERHRQRGGGDFYDSDWLQGKK